MLTLRLGWDGGAEEGRKGSISGQQEGREMELDSSDPINSWSHGKGAPAQDGSDLDDYSRERCLHRVSLGRVMKASQPCLS